VDSFKDFADDENVRKYLLKPEGKQKARRSLVHHRIKETLEQNANKFSLLNGGFCLIAAGARVDDSNKTIKLENCSIVNGSQTQGEIQQFLAGENYSLDDLPSVFYQLIVIDDRDNEENHEIVAEISVARNFQNDVKLISIAGVKGQIDRLEKAFREQRNEPDAKFRKSESDFDKGMIDTEKLIQVLWAVMPKELDGKKKPYAYAQKIQCLRRYVNICESFADKSKETSASDKRQYEFFIDHVGEAWSLYEKWRRHPGFEGTGLWTGKGKARQEEIDKDGKRITVMADGIVFPILAAHSVFFVERGKQKWNLEIPQSFLNNEKNFIVKNVKTTYMSIASSNPNVMGKFLGCYEALEGVTEYTKTLFAIS